MRSVYLQEAGNDTCLLVRASLLKSIRKGRDGEGASLMKNPLFGGDRALGRESGPVRRREAREPPLN